MLESKLLALSQSLASESLSYPSALQLEKRLGLFENETMVNLEKYITDFRNRPGNTHAAKDLASREMMGFEDAISNYLAAGVMESVGMLGIVGRAAAKIERDLIESCRPSPFLISEKQQRAVLFDSWQAFIRILVAMRVVISLAPRHLWKKVDGDAALFIADRQTTAWLDLLPIAEQMLQAFIAEASEPNMSALAEREFDGFRKLPKEIQGWLQGAQSARSAGELGSEYPFDFCPIPPKYIGRASTDTSAQPSHMYARKATLSRLDSLSMYWEAVRAHWVNSSPRILTNATQFQMMVTAGTLHRGGAHPPHKTHRDGSMLDLDLTAPGKRESLQLVRRDLPRLGLVSASEDESDIEEDADGPIAGARNIRWGMVNEEGSDWVLPSGPDLAMRTLAVQTFTECILLTYPSSVLLASDGIRRQAWENVISRAWQLRSNADKNDRSLLERILVLLSNKAVMIHLSEEDRKTHATHWHVNYNPQWLGAEGRIPSLNQKKADEITAVMKATEDAGLWRGLLGLPTL
jgi:hypothetical protein